MLYEGGFRIIELGTLTWEQVQFDEYGVIVNVNCKTEKARYVRLVMATSYLAAWRHDYPYKPEGDALVFVTQKRRPIRYDGVSQQLKKIAVRAGITKRITPHLFRHSRITHMHRQGYHESIIKQMMWGHQGTRMMQAYTHLTGSDIDQEVLRVHGLSLINNESQESLKAQQCIHCKAINGPLSRYCATCGQPLTEEEKQCQKEIVQEIESHPLYISLLNEIREKVAENAGGD